MDDETYETVTCPRCGARPGETCRTSDRVPRPPHKRRRRSAQEVADVATPDGG